VAHRILLEVMAHVIYRHNCASSGRRLYSGMLSQGDSTCDIVMMRAMISVSITGIPTRVGRQRSQTVLLVDSLVD
jgi:hypothetical protein